MKTCVSSYSFSGAVRAGKISWTDVPRLVKDMGFDCIEFSELEAPEGESTEKLLELLGNLCVKFGLPVENYAVGSDFLNAPSGVEGEIERLTKVMLPRTQLLGAKRMRHDATRGYTRVDKGGKSFENALPTLAHGYRSVTEVAGGIGIETMIENHGFFAQDSNRVEALICAVGNDNFGALLDVGNFLCADEESPKAVGLLANYAKHVHVKDFHVKKGSEIDPGDGWFQSRGGNYLRGAIIGHGVIPIVQCLRLLKKSGYAGAVSIEFEGMEDALTGIRLGKKNLDRFLSMI